MIDKTYLQNHAEHRAEYEDEMRRYELISESGYYTSPAQLSGITYGTGKISSRTENEVMHKVDSLDYIEKLKQLIEKEEAAIEAVVEKLPKAKLKTVIRIKYYQRCNWEDISFFMYGDEPDYMAHPDHYKTKAQRMHGTALNHMKRIQEETA